MARPGWWWAVGATVIGAWATCALAAPESGQSRAAFEAPSALLVDVPTAGTTPKGTVETRGRAFPAGGIELRLDLGVLDRVSVGVGFGGVQIIGDGDPRWDPRPGFALKARVLDETWTLPAFALGIDTRGAGFWDRDRERFQFKSRGFYAVLSKNYAFLGDFSFHGGASRSFEAKDDGDPTLFAGLEKSVGSRIGLGVEYDLARNDDRKDGAYGRGRGYLNAVLRMRPGPQVEVRVVVRDMLDNSELAEPRLADVVADEGWGREVALSYYSNLF
ncbi:MAG: hypothetical protein U0167_05395 [bacterium]